MNRIIFIMAFFTAASLLTQCDPAGCGIGGAGTIVEPSPIGLSILETSFKGNSTYPYIKTKLGLLYAKETPASFNFISSAYACSPNYIPGNFKLSSLLDSVIIKSEPMYNNIPLEDQLSFSSESVLSVSSFNDYINRDGVYVEDEVLIYELSEKPTESDSFTFSFYYYKDGAIIDSSSTQKYFISE